MKTKVSLDTIYAHSEDAIAREIAGEFIIIPIVSGVGDLEEGMFTLNNTGRAIWDKLNGKRSLKYIVDSLSLEFQAPIKKIEKDSLGLVEELLKRRMLIEVKRG
jgi:hypothetical protein